MSITDTVPLPVLATYSRLPSALIANALGEEPTEIGWVPATLGLASISCAGGGVDHRHGVAAGVGHIHPGAVGGSPPHRPGCYRSAR